MSCERIHLRLLFKGRHDYFTRPILVSFGLSISSQCPVLTSQLESALVEIRNTIIWMFNQWEHYFLGRYAPPVQLRFLLSTAVEFNVQDVERARKRVRKFRGAERGIVVGRKVGGRRGLPTASNANVKTGE